jgi:short-subunit dehydrogenase
MQVESRRLSSDDQKNKTVNLSVVPNPQSTRRMTMHVAITGASSGIGRALAVEYGRAGAKLTLVARRRELLEEVAREIGREVHIVAQDLSDPERAAEWLLAAEDVNGPVDVLVNNAGVMSIGATAELDARTGQRMLDVCLSAPLRLTRAVLPGMLERGGGTVVQVASMASFATPPGGTWYGAAKAGLASFSESLRHELKGTGVNVLTVYPGPVATPLADAAYAAYAPSRIVDALPAGNPQELATLIRSGVARGSARIVYPRFYRMGQLFPGFARWLTRAASPTLKAHTLTQAHAAVALPAVSGDGR